MKKIVLLITVLFAFFSTLSVYAEEVAVGQQTTFYLKIQDTKDAGSQDPLAVVTTTNSFIAKNPEYEILSISVNSRSMQGGGISYYGVWVVVRKRLRLPRF